MNHFEINIVASETDGGTPLRHLRILIDGNDLIALLRSYEKPFATREGSPEIAGSYSRLPASDELKERFLGQSRLRQGEMNDKVAMLECQCGLPGCWPFLVKITMSDTSVSWSDFEQPHRASRSSLPAWDYAGFGPFEFEREQYLEQIAKLESLTKNQLGHPPK